MAEEYSQEFKEKVLGEFDAGGNMTEVGRFNGLPLSTLKGWIRERKKSKKQPQLKNDSNFVKLTPVPFSQSNSKSPSVDKKMVVRFELSNGIRIEVFQ